MRTATIEVRDLRKVYAGEVEAVKGIDFDVAAGEVFGLLGPNGAGKSTTIGMLTTTILPTGGSARLAGLDVVADPRGARAIASVVFQEPVVDGGLSGLDNLSLHARLWGIGPEQQRTRIAELVPAFGLQELIERPVDTYSGGQRRRLEIARALVSRPQVLFLDEPTVGLDARIRHELLDLIAGLRERFEMTILLSTHYLEEARQLCDRVAIMYEGSIVGLDAPARLLAELGEEILELRVQGDARATLARLRAQGIAAADAFAIGATVTVPLHGRPAGQALGALEEAAISPVGMATRAPTLDDVYLQLTGGPAAEAA
ncbi:MAG TPA: ABC transporter ATP-binding protein [Solirubrobacteraceae bacterium]|jgi:ABC-2 type transport system ATP-binding protein|nr:ABC transporter ATP-binding protein [Solirubrobacteraceae bacterium]